MSGLVKVFGELSDSSQVESAVVNILNNSATSAHIFSGEKIRKFPDEKYRFKGMMAPTESLHDKISSSTLTESKNHLDCIKWAVVTTIFSPPSEAVRRLLYRKEWCVVVVGDMGKPGNVSLRNCNTFSGI